MADKSNIIITMNDHISGKAQQKTITDINPAAASSKLATWGQMTAALSKDSYVKTTRIDKTECDTPKTQIAMTAMTMRVLSGNTYAPLTFDGHDATITVPLSDVRGTAPNADTTFYFAPTVDGQPVLVDDCVPLVSDISGAGNWSLSSYALLGMEWRLAFASANRSAGVWSFKITIPETRNHAGWVTNVTITIEEGE